VGNARTALYNWLFARRTGGRFILRIEDTDLERSEIRYEAQLIEDLRWLGLDWDEGPGDPGQPDKGAFGPYRQSERLAIYAEHTERLLAEGKAYRCFCTLKNWKPSAKSPLWPSAARRSTPAAAAICSQRRSTEPCRRQALRRAAQDRTSRCAFTTWFAARSSLPPRRSSDPILVRSARRGRRLRRRSGLQLRGHHRRRADGITHVIRGDDHISNTPKQVAIYQAFGWPVPEFAHLSTILGADRERLSKRHGATSISTFREMGYLPEALVNYLALLGWGAEDGKTETFTLDELTQAFRSNASPLARPSSTSTSSTGSTATTSSWPTRTFSQIRTLPFNWAFHLRS
jgi:nondiscriminating glutamyl-tRNA synthetase